MAITVAGALVLAACGDDDDAGSGAFCDAAMSYQAANVAPNPSTASAEELETTFTDLQNSLEQLQSTAPSEIEADVAVVASTFEDLISAFAAQDYDYASLTTDPEGQRAMEALSSQEMGTAMGNIAEYIAAECTTATTG
jgi:hypothetical protein